MIDRDESIRIYRKEVQRRHSNRRILVVVGCVCALVIIVCAATITLSLIGGN